MTIMQFSYSLAPMGDIEIFWSCCMWSLYLHGRTGRSMFSCWGITVLIGIQGMKREEISCMSGSNQWLEPKCTKQIPYLELRNIDFTSAEKNERREIVAEEGASIH